MGGINSLHRWPANSSGQRRRGHACPVRGFLLCSVVGKAQLEAVERSGAARRREGRTGRLGTAKRSGRTPWGLTLGRLQGQLLLSSAGSLQLLLKQQQRKPLFSYLFFYCGAGEKARASSLPGKRSTTELHPGPGCFGKSTGTFLSGSNLSLVSAAWRKSLRPPRTGARVP